MNACAVRVRCVCVRLGAYVIENDEAEGVIGLEIVEQGHHAVLALALYLGERTGAKGDVHGARDVEYEGQLNGRAAVFSDALPV